MARRLREQRELLRADEEPSPSYIQNFKVSHNLARALSLERKTSPGGGTAYLKNKQRQLQFVEDARRQPRPPFPSVLAEQQVLQELRRDATSVVVSADEAIPLDQREKRREKRNAFLASRKGRHDESLHEFEQKMDELAETCQKMITKISECLCQCVEDADNNIDESLQPLEVNTDDLGKKDEGQVRGIMTKLEEIIDRRKTTIEDQCNELENVDTDRLEQSMLLKHKLVTDLTASAHVVPGEIERIIEQKALGINTALLENKKSIKTLRAKLLVQTLEKSKENKKRWHEGFLLWKQKRHCHSVETVLERLRGNEFRRPDALVNLQERVQKEQNSVFASRSKVVDEMFSTAFADLKGGLVSGWEARNTDLNESTQEIFDDLIHKLQDLIEGLKESGENMLSDLCEELERHDARQEWKEHETVTDLINADIRPMLDKCLEKVSQEVHILTEDVSKQEEVQHHVVTQLIAFFQTLAKHQESLETDKFLVEANYQGEVKDCVKGFEEKCDQNKARMEKFKEDIHDAPHHEDLEILKEDAFEFLTSMQQEYHDHAQEVIALHTGFPSKIAEFVQKNGELLCKELGLITKKAQLEIDPKRKLKPWPEASSCRLEVLEVWSVDQLREHLLRPKQDETSGEGEQGDMPEVLPPEDARQASPGLQFDSEELTKRLAGLRSNVFAELATCREQLDSVDIDEECEKVRKELDQRIRKHTNRKGEVQVEWYVPRYGIIAKRKDKFERHKIDIAQKAQRHDDQSAVLFVEMEEKETTYKDALQVLAGKLGDAETLPMLTAKEREATDLAAWLETECRHTTSKLLRLATTEPQALQRENASFLTMCRKSENYSTAEDEFYSAEIQKLNDALKQKERDRMAALREKEPLWVELRKTQLEEFTREYKDKVELLCSTKGYGVIYGKPRRTAQGICRKHLSIVMNARQNVSKLVDYFAALCQVPVTEKIEVSSLPQCPLFQLRDHFPSDTWVFTAELIGTFKILVCALNEMGTHLEAFKQEYADGHRLEESPLVCVLREEKPLYPADEPPDPKSKNSGASAQDRLAYQEETKLRDACLSQTLLALQEKGVFSAVWGALVQEEADAYRGDLLDFKDRLLAAMTETQTLRDSARHEAIVSVRERGDTLRESTLLDMGDALFGELTTRSLRELYDSTGKEHERSAEDWVQKDKMRLKHEKQLSPDLANPNYEEDLRRLMDAEAKRHQEATELMAQDFQNFGGCLRKQADKFVERLAANFEAAVRLLDALPLHRHFKALPGDEQIEAPRISIKRRLRRIQNGADLDQGEELPKRTWDGLPLYELRRLLEGGEWPEDPTFADASPEKLAKSSPAVVSFRSPVHKKLFERRTCYYKQFQAEFTAEVNRRLTELNARKAKVTAGQKNWRSMIIQLKGEADNNEAT